MYVRRFRNVTALLFLALLEEFLQGWQKGGRQLPQRGGGSGFFSQLPELNFLQIPLQHMNGLKQHLYHWRNTELLAATRFAITPDCDECPFSKGVAIKVTEKHKLNV